ncbi:sigma-70 family RNA polymerase sigma factor [Candidatus Poribacteria bacterium]|jgi:RNA polymerase sigma-70 factor, ECF subfamily|nr:sigma-70 family RNA polymerase sigma factor [Candidatus Poribacteria bacterium]MBT5531993.1 sigma-70 family RNA polymerase sigma factor [Candidatus Poribacteria bacterium]MBT5711070.1 sigma-70 family RNA polymerase sigma factor [Candidatus Poribacteria bacterium]MBT7097468.1 sigma-70 family RNA polymerase sigma factor [Candidatus Poribacteria bacterium]MBT7808622.1 sigma-70 family RNA polymerase sigma factor [Candidatus Poribacteria bacterium]
MDWTEAIPRDIAGQPDAVDAHSAFVTFVEKHRDQAYRVARGMMPSHEAADDVVQEAFLKAFTSLGKFRRDAEMDTWLYRIVMNVALNRLRGSRRRLGFLDRLRRDGGHMARRPTLPHVALEHAEAREQVQAAVMELAPGLRAVVVLFDLEGLSCAEVSGALGIPEGTVRSRLHNARRHLRTRLEPYFHGSSRER